MASQPEQDRPRGPADPDAEIDRAPAVAPVDTQRLVRQLTGVLPCAACRYDLRGLSVRDACPECGTPIRATILAAVDPYAGVLRPISHPRLTAIGILSWAGAALAAALLTWALRGADAYAAFAGVPLPTRTIAAAGVACIVMSALGATVLLRPHGGIPAWQILTAAGGVLAMLLAAAVYWQIHGVFDPTHAKPYFMNDPPFAERTRLRLLEEALLLAALLGLRPNARLLAARSLLLRMGRVDRQTMLAMAAALGVAMLGDLLHLLLVITGEGPARIGTTLGNFLIAVGSMLFTLGLAGVLVDCLRIAPVLLRPPLTYRQLVAPTPRVARPEAAS